MDPNVALNRIRELLKKYEVDGGEEMSQYDAGELFNHTEALVNWLDGGGFLPANWNSLRQPWTGPEPFNE